MRIDIIYKKSIVSTKGFELQCLINPWHTRAAMATVVVLCVCQPVDDYSCATGNDEAYE